MVTKEVILGTHEHIYKMEELTFMSARIFLRTIKLLEELEEELKKTKDTLDTHAEEMRNLNGYQRIYTITTQLLRIISPQSDDCDIHRRRIEVHKNSTMKSISPVTTFAFIFPSTLFVRTSLDIENQKQKRDEFFFILPNPERKKNK